MKILTLIASTSLGISAPINLTSNLLNLENNVFIDNFVVKSDLAKYQEILLKPENKNNIIRIDEDFNERGLTNSLKDKILYKIEDILTSSGFYEVSGAFINHRNDFDFKITYNDKHQNNYAKKLVLQLTAKSSNLYFFENTKIDFWFICDYITESEISTGTSLDFNWEFSSNWSTYNRFDETGTYFLNYKDFAIKDSDFLVKYDGISINYRATALNYKNENVLNKPYETVRTYKFDDISESEEGDEVFQVANREIAGWGLESAYRITMSLYVDVQPNKLKIQTRAHGFVRGYGSKWKSVKVGFYIYSIKLLT